jgi:hypothetical protein
MEMNNYHKHLLKRYFNSNNIQPIEQYNFKLHFDMLVSICFDFNHHKNIFSTPTKILLKKIDKSDRIELSNKMVLIKILIKLLKYTNKPYKEAYNQLRNYYIEMLKGDTILSSEIIENSLFNYTNLIELLNSTNGSDYLLLYLLINFPIPNQEALTLYSNDKIIIKEALEKTSEENILHFNTDGNVVYIRGFYSAISIYTIESYVITDKKFIKILLNKQSNSYININSNNQPIKNQSIDNHLFKIGNRYIKNSNLSTSVIYNIVKNI